MKRSGGFTLLEIVIALAIAALGITAVAKATGGAATVAGETQERMLAVWTASNRLSELRITRAWPAPGSQEVTSKMGGRTWYLAQKVSGTDDEDIRRVDITVFTDPRHTAREYQAFGYVARYRSEEESQNGTQDQGNGGNDGGANGTQQGSGQGTDGGGETPPGPDTGQPAQNASKGGAT